MGFRAPFPESGILFQEADKGWGKPEICHGEVCWSEEVFDPEIRWSEISKVA